MTRFRRACERERSGTTVSVGHEVLAPRPRARSGAAACRRRWGCLHDAGGHDGVMRGAAPMLPQRDVSQSANVAFLGYFPTFAAERRLKRRGRRTRWTGVIGT